MSIRPRSRATRRLPAVAAPARAGDVGLLEPDEVLWRDEVRRRLRALTTALTLAIAVAVVALGSALWALLAGADDDRGASVRRVTLLEQRVQRLEGLANGSASREGLAAVREQQRSLTQRVDALDDRLQQPAGEVAALRTAVDGTQQAVEQLEQRIAELEQQSPVP